MVLSREQIESAFNKKDFLLLGVVRPEVLADYARYEAWLNRGLFVGMDYLVIHKEARRNIDLILKDTRSVIVFALAYFQGRKSLDVKEPQVAQYARFSDYHRIIKSVGDEVVRDLFPQIQSHQYRVVSDTAPVLERAFAAHGSRGFIGKNTCFIHPEWGSFLLLGEIFTAEVLDFDEPAKVDPLKHLAQGGCGKCNRCQVKCPTGALSEDYVLDARLCLSYWTIENRGPIPFRFWPHLAQYYFGCDICQLVCPYNLKQPVPELPERFSTRKLPTLFETAVMNEKQYQEWFGGTPLTRAKRNGLRRNALIALRVTSSPLLDEALRIARVDSASPIQETIDDIERSLSDPELMN